MVKVLSLTIAAALVAPAAATTGELAVTHQVVTANNYYVPGDAQVVPLPPLTILAGDSLIHTNFDADLHDLVSTGFRPDGQPWFDSDLIGQGEQASVPVERVPPGVYSFTCSIHPFMSGTLEIKASPLPQEEEEEPDYTVSSGDSFFQPRTLTVPVGSTVQWRNDGSLDHTVTASDGSWDSSPTCPMTGACWGPGETYTHTFTTAGAVPYYCKLHGTPGGGGHAGTITVVDPMNTPTTVNSLSAARTGPSLSVNGIATFGGELPFLVAEDAVGDSPTGQTAGLGVDIASVWIHRPDPDRAEIQFVWKVTQLDREPPPEIVRYLWQMKLDNSREYWIQGKTSDFLSGTNIADDPSGHAQHTQGAFKLRGNCGPIVADVPNVTTCRHVSWLTGTFDATRDEVRVRVPLGTSAAPEFAPGAEITPFGTIAAGFQAGVSNNSTEDQVSAENPYRIAQKEVSLGIATAGTPEEDVELTSPAALGASGAFNGSVSLSDLPPGSYDVWAKACFGTKCGTRKTTVTI